jgi:hypothetical protein
MIKRSFLSGEVKCGTEDEVEVEVEVVVVDEMEVEEVVEEDVF